MVRARRTVDDRFLATLSRRRLAGGPETSRRHVLSREESALLHFCAVHSAALSKYAHHGARLKRERFHHSEKWSLVELRGEQWRKFRAFSKESLIRLRSLAWLRKYAGAAAEDVLRLCQRGGILSELKQAVKLAEECFPSARGLRVFVDHDPEEDESQWIIVEISAWEPVNEFLDAYNHCISVWADKIATVALAHIRLSYNFT